MASEQTMIQAIAQAAIEVVKEAILVVRETENNDEHIRTT